MRNTERDEPYDVEEEEDRQRPRRYRDPDREERRAVGGYKKMAGFGAILATGIGLLAWSHWGGGDGQVVQRTASTGGGSGASDFHMASNKAEPVGDDRPPTNDNSWRNPLENQDKDPGFPSPVAWNKPISAPPAPSDAASAAQEKEKDPFTAAMTASPEPPSRAWMSAHPLYTIPAGDMVEILMDTATDSTLPGYARAHLPEAVWNESGHVRLLDKGTYVYGQIRQGLVNGLNRLFLVWALARTPQGIRIVINSPMADELGRAGMGGDINNHLLQRFAPAFLFSLITNGPSALAAGLSSHNQYGNGSNNSSYFQLLTPNQQLAADALAQQMNIPPTLTANQASRGMVMVASDWDLSCCVSVEPVNGPIALERGRR